MSPDITNDPHASSWVRTANGSGGDFPIQNLPVAVFRRRESSAPFRGGIAIGDQVLDLAALAATGVFSGDAALALNAAARSTLNELMQLGPKGWIALRRALFEALLEGSALRPKLEPCLVPQAAAVYSVPAQIGDFTDFYSSLHHATAVGRLFRPDNPLTPNYKWMPIGYHGRSSSIGISGQDFHRPRGQRLPPGESRPMFEPSVRLDYELELGVFLGNGNSLGSWIPIESAESHVFGLCLLNDWSARDLQAWEYQPLGPFLSKNFATTISPWIVSLQALAPYRTPHSRAADDPEPPAYLISTANEAAGGFDIRLEAYLETAAMHAHREPPQRLSSTSFRHSYWTVAQLVAHHTVGGCNLRAGDLLGTGTQSGPGPGEAGSLLELSVGGKHSMRVGSSEHRSFLEDGDTVIFRGWCAKPGAARVGFGEVRGRVLPAVSDPLFAAG
ncbi:MAG: fumarylacetoacetase [Steroidobacteraceae bacterium]